MSILPLRQSLYETATCPHGYGVQVIKGRKMPGGTQSFRGTEIHAVMSAYINHCGKRHVSADWPEFDRLAAGAGLEASAILNGLRDNYIVDHEHLFDTELTLRREEPIDDDYTLEGEGTLDGLFFLTRAKAKIEDFKSHPQPFAADTFQSHLYPFLVFMNFPDVEEVTFELIFVRYTNARRSVTFTRDDLPMLRQMVISARIRLTRLHERYEAGQELEAIPGNHCQYCPLLHIPAGCPIAEFNEHANAPIEEWLRFAVWAEKALALARQTLRAAVDASGRPVQIRDGNERLVQIGFAEKQSVQYPLLPTIPLLLDYRHAAPDDVAWLDKTRISSTGFASYLKTKKRAVLHQAILDQAAETVTKTEFSITLPAETEETAKANPWEEE